LKGDFEIYSPPYFYSIKEGDWKLLSREEKKKYGGRKINLIRATQAMYAFLKDPAFARRYRSELFSKKYHDIFKKGTQVEEVLLPWRILEIVDAEISRYRKEEFNLLKTNPEAFNDEKKQEIQRREFLLYSNLMFLNFIRKLIQLRYGEYTPSIAKKLLNNQLKSRVRSLMGYIVAVLSYEDWLLQEKNLPRFLKSKNNIDQLYLRVEKDIQKDKSRGKDPLKQNLPNI